MIKLDETIKDFDGKDKLWVTSACPTCGSPKKQDIYTLRRVFLEALGNAARDEGTSGEDVIKQYKLGVKISDAGATIELTPDEIMLLRSCVEKWWRHPLIIAQAMIALGVEV